MDNLKRVWDTLGRQPLYNEMAAPLSAFYVTAYVHRYGSWNKALEAFVEWLKVESRKLKGDDVKQKTENGKQKNNKKNAALALVPPDGRKQKQKINRQQKKSKPQPPVVGVVAKRHQQQKTQQKTNLTNLKNLTNMMNVTALAEAEERLKMWNKNRVGKGNGKRKQNKNGYKTLSKGTRYDVLKRDNFKCVLCGRSPAVDPKIILHIDHIIPKSKGGDNKPANLQTLCSDCNWGKATKSN